MATRWDYDTTLKFIKLYKSQPCLWDSTISDYRKRPKRDAAYIALAEGMDIPGFSVQDAKYKIKNIRSTYLQEIKRIQESNIKSEAGHKNAFVSNLRWLHEMDEVFAKNLKKEVFDDSYISNNEATESEVSDSAIWWTEESPISIVEVVSMEGRTPSAPTNPPKSTIDKTHRVSRAKKRRTDSSPDHKIMNDSNNLESETQWDAFGKSVAMQLKSMAVHNALLAQCQLQTILTEFGLQDHREKVAESSKN